GSKRAILLPNPLSLLPGVSMSFIAKLLRFWVILAFLALTGYVAIHNPDRVTLRLPPVIAHVNVPVYAAFMMALLTGAALVCFFFGFEHMKKTWTIRQLQRRLQLAERGDAAGAYQPEGTLASREGPT